VRGLREKRRPDGEKIRSAALAICRKRGGAITRASRRRREGPAGAKQEGTPNMTAQRLVLAFERDRIQLLALYLYRRRRGAA
jgi:hypothetical protein